MRVGAFCVVIAFMTSWRGPNWSTMPSRRTRSLSATVITDMREAVDSAGGVGPRGFIRIEYSEMQRLMNLQDLSGYELELDWHDLQSHLVARFIWTREYYAWAREHEHELEPIKSMAMRLNDTSPLA